jgi:hypothetical protein
LGLDLSCYQTFIHRVLAVNPGPLMLLSSYNLETLALCNEDSKPTSQGSILLGRFKGYAASSEDFDCILTAAEVYREQQTDLKVCFHLLVEL